MCSCAQIQINPSLLPKREVGRPTEAIKEALGVAGNIDLDADALAASGGPVRVFGKQWVARGIDGAEILAETQVQDTACGEPLKKKRRVEDSVEESEDDDNSEVQEDEEEKGGSSFRFYLLDFINILLDMT